MSSRGAGLAAHSPCAQCRRPPHCLNTNPMVGFGTPAATRLAPVRACRAGEQGAGVRGRRPGGHGGAADHRQCCARRARGVTRETAAPGRWVGDLAGANCECILVAEGPSHHKYVQHVDGVRMGANSARMHLPVLLNHENTCTMVERENWLSCNIHAYRSTHNRASPQLSTLAKQGEHSRAALGGIQAAHVHRAAMLGKTSSSVLRHGAKRLSKSTASLDTARKRFSMAAHLEVAATNRSRLGH